MDEVILFARTMMLVKSGQTLAAAYTTVYGSQYFYLTKTTKEQRAWLMATRKEITAVNRLKKNRTPERFTFAMPTELKTKVRQHCKSRGITVTGFINNSIRSALK